jgi:heptosyltransferase I
LPATIRPFSETRSVRIVLLTGLGDVVHGLPLVNAMKRANPDVRITWVVEPMPAGILAPHASIDRVVVFHRKDGMSGIGDLRQQLRGDTADLTLNLNIYFKSLFPTLLSPSPVRLGFDRRRARDGVAYANTHHLPARPRAHTQDMFLEFLEVLGIPAEPLEWRLEITAAERHGQQEFRRRLDGRPIAAIVPATANPRKDWMTERWVTLANRLHEEMDLQPVLIGGPGRRENEIARTIIQQSTAPVVDALGDGVRRLLWLIDCSRLIIAPDTGPVHIARALDVPVVGLYGHTNPWRVGPYRRFEDLWIDRYTKPGAVPDPSAFDPKHGRMELITTDDVMEKVRVACARYAARSA